MVERMALCAVVLWSLACTGLTEKAVELSTGGDLEISENGDITMEMPDGTKIVTRQGGAIPDGFPLPPPYPDAPVQAVVITTSPSGDESWIATYEMARPSAEIAATYREWLDANATAVQEKKESVAGMVTQHLTGTYQGGMVAISLTEAYGSNTVSAIWAPQGEGSLPR